MVVICFYKLMNWVQNIPLTYWTFDYWARHNRLFELWTLHTGCDSQITVICSLHQLLKMSHFFLLLADCCFLLKKLLFCWRLIRGTCLVSCSKYRESITDAVLQNRPFETPGDDQSVIEWCYAPLLGGDERASKGWREIEKQGWKTDKECKICLCVFAERA